MMITDTQYSKMITNYSTTALIINVSLRSIKVTVLAKRVIFITPFTCTKTKRNKF